MISLGILTGSVRPTRFNIQPAEWVLEHASSHDEIEAELLDVMKLDLPLMNEPNPPAISSYTHEHTKAWSSKVAELDAFVWVSPEYNHSTSAALKNAIDYLFYEWNHKPVGIVSYGSLAGGARAAEHLRAVAGEVKMYDIREQILLPNYWEKMDDEGEYQFSESQEKELASMLEQLAFWGEVMREAREKLAADISE